MRVLSTAWRYGLAVISCGLALAAAIPLDAPSSCLFLAVMVSNLFGGKGPGGLSVLLSSLAFDYFFLPPIYDFRIQPSLYPRFAAFLVPVLLITVVIEAKRRVEEARRWKTTSALLSCGSRVRMCGCSTRSRTQVFPTRSGWSFNSTPRKTRVQKCYILKSMGKTDVGRTFAAAGGPAEC